MAEDNVKDTINRGKYIFAKDFPGSLIAEAYRTLRANVLLSDIDKGVRTLVVTSPGRGEGKSTVCANLAVVMSQAEKKVLLLDCDLRLPTQQDLFELSPDRGLTRILSPLEEAHDQEFGDEAMFNLAVIGSGPPPPNPSEFISSRRFRNFLKDVASRYDMVIIDTPPVGLVSDAAILATMVDATLMVMDPDRGSRSMALRSRKVLENVNANLIGVVMNNVRTSRESYPHTY